MILMTIALITREVALRSGGTICPKRPTKIAALTQPKKPEKARRCVFICTLIRRLSEAYAKKGSTSLDCSTSLGGSAL
ncbi:MAG: hypothetical protein J7K48_07170 [Thermococcus sp.]|nr:hypothetical protein [Thermococcus sp.]